MMLWIAAVVVGVWCAWVVYCDLATGRLPNRLTLGGALVAFLARLVFGGVGEATLSVGAGLVAGAFLLIPFFLKAAGGGDVKLLFAVGILSGWPTVLAALFWISVVGLLLAVGKLLASGALWRCLAHAGQTCFNPAYDRKEGRAALADVARVRIRFGTPIVAGTLLAFVIPL